MQQTHGVEIENFHGLRKEDGVKAQRQEVTQWVITSFLHHHYLSHFSVFLTLLPRVIQLIVLLSHAPRLDAPPNPLSFHRLRP
jgi:hypothetical protein